MADLANKTAAQWDGAITAWATNQGWNLVKERYCVSAIKNVFRDIQEDFTDPQSRMANTCRDMNSASRMPWTANTAATLARAVKNWYSKPPHYTRQEIIVALEEKLATKQQDRIRQGRSRLIATDLEAVGVILDRRRAAATAGGGTNPPGVTGPPLNNSASSRPLVALGAGANAPSLPGLTVDISGSGRPLGVLGARAHDPRLPGPTFNIPGSNRPLVVSAVQVEGSAAPGVLRVDQTNGDSQNFVPPANLAHGGDAKAAVAAGENVRSGVPNGKPAVVIDLSDSDDNEWGIGIVELRPVVGYTAGTSSNLKRARSPLEEVEGPPRKRSLVHKDSDGYRNLAEKILPILYRSKIDVADTMRRVVETEVAEHPQSGVAVLVTNIKAQNRGEYQGEAVIGVSSAANEPWSSVFEHGNTETGASRVRGHTASRYGRRDRGGRRHRDYRDHRDHRGDGNGGTFWVNPSDYFGGSANLLN